MTARQIADRLEPAVSDVVRPKVGRIAWKFLSPWMVRIIEVAVLVVVALIAPEWLPLIRALEQLIAAMGDKMSAEQQDTLRGLVALAQTPPTSIEPEIIAAAKTLT